MGTGPPPGSPPCGSPTSPASGGGWELPASAQLPGFAGLEHAKPLRRNACCDAGLDQRPLRSVDRLVSELECAVMVGERGFRPEIEKGLDAFPRVHVLLAHEPAGLVRSDRQDGEPERTVPARLAEPPAVAVAGISHVIDPAGGRLDRERRP